MSERNSKIIAIIFIIVVFIFGSATLINCKEDMGNVFEAVDFASAKTEIENSIQENFKSKNNRDYGNKLFEREIIRRFF